MDESERLVAVAALAPPEEALAAWRAWRETTEIGQASGLLVWAGGYIHRNLLAAGLDESYLGGIYRYNLIANNRRIAAMLPTIRELASRWRITPLKSFGMSSASYSRGLRPLADFDFFVAASDIHEARSFITSKGFSANLDVSEREFEVRIVPQRGSWNFMNAERGDLDLHWRVFDHLDLDANEELVAANSSVVDSEFGVIRRLDDELMLVVLTVHSVIESENSLRGLFDIYHLLKAADVDRVAALAAQVGVQRDLLGVCDAITSIVGTSAIPQVGRLADAIREGAMAQPVPGSVVTAPETGELLDERFVETAYLRDPERYRAWYAAGRPAESERPGRAVRPQTRPLPGDRRSKDPSVRSPAVRGTPTIGWHYLYPGQGYRWANVPDARIVFERSWRRRTRARIELEPDAWAAAPVERFDVFSNGVWIGTCDKTSSTFEFDLPPARRPVELSLRLHGLDRYESAGAHINWHRMLAPVRRIELI